MDPSAMIIANEALRTACDSYFGVYAPFMIKHHPPNGDSDLLTNEGILPVIELLNAYNVNKCYVKYNFIGRDFSNPTVRTATKVYFSRLIILFGGPREDEEILIDASSASRVLSRYYPLNVVTTICTPLMTQADRLANEQRIAEKQAADKIAQLEAPISAQYEANKKLMQQEQLLFLR